jgi:hypothetical protein
MNFITNIIKNIKLKDNTNKNVEDLYTDPYTAEKIKHLSKRKDIPHLWVQQFNIWFQYLLYSYNNQDSLVLMERQTNISINREEIQK